MKLRGKHRPSKLLANPKHSSAPMLHGAHTRVESVEVPDYLSRDVNRTKAEDHLILYATNGFAMVRLDLGKPEHGDEPGPIPALALKHMERGVNVALNEGTIRVGITSYDRVVSEASPESNPVMPDVDDVLGKAKPSEDAKRRVTIALNPKLLLNLASAMEAEDGVYLVIDTDKLEKMTAPGRTDEQWYGGAISVTGRRETGAEGMIMPIRPIGA